MLGRDHINTWAEMKRVMRRCFIPSSYRHDLCNRLQTLKQGSKSVDEYFKEMELILHWRCVLVILWLFHSLSVNIVIKWSVMWCQCKHANCCWEDHGCMTVMFRFVVVLTRLFSCTKESASLCFLFHRRKFWRMIWNENSERARTTYEWATYIVREWFHNQIKLHIYNEPSHREKRD
jgi:hypothetical protein